MEKYSITVKVDNGKIAKRQSREMFMNAPHGSRSHKNKKAYSRKSKHKTNHVKWVHHVAETTKQSASL